MLHKDPLVSVVMMTYNHEPFLEQAVTSVAAQKAPFPIELVIAEDCSTDGTRRLAFELQARYPHLVRVIYSDANRGAAPNFRLGDSLCRGRYIAVLEGDDFWIDEAKLARQVRAMELRPDVDIGFSRGFLLYEDGSRVLGWDRGEEERVVGTRELFGGYGWLAPSASLIWRQHVFRSLPSWVDNANFGDVLVLIAGSVRGGAWYDPTPSVCYRIAQPTSFTARLERAPSADRIKSFEEMIRYTDAVCRHYGFPKAHISHRLDDWRLAIAKVRLAEKQPLRALKALSAIHPRFFIEGAARRLQRALRLSRPNRPARP